MTKPLEGQVAVITGASQGLGLAIAKTFAAAGAKLVLCARTPADLEKARAAVIAAGSSGADVAVVASDVSKKEDARRIADEALRSYRQVDILVNNAGIYGPMGPLEAVDWDQWVHAVSINLFGVALMCKALLPHFKSRRRGKIINLSGGGATAPLPNVSAYAASKAAVVRLTETLALECAPYGICVNSVAPGALNTRLVDEVVAAGPEKVGEAFYRKNCEIKRSGGAGLQPGADLCLFLASALSDGITGRLISAHWDPWRDLGKKAPQLEKSDVYTLRRIVPADRGLDWDK